MLIKRQVEGDTCIKIFNISCAIKNIMCHDERIILVTSLCVSIQNDEDDTFWLEGISLLLKGCHVFSFATLPGNWQIGKGTYLSKIITRDSLRWNRYLTCVAFFFHSSIRLIVPRAALNETRERIVASTLMLAETLAVPKSGCQKRLRYTNRRKDRLAQIVHNSEINNGIKYRVIQRPTKSRVVRLYAT